MGKKTRKETSASDCGKKEFYESGKCEECPKCPAGYGLVQTCGYGKGAGVTCQKCPPGKYRVDGDSPRCISCHNCTLYKRGVTYKCRPDADAVCGDCLEGYYDPHGSQSASKGSMLEICMPCPESSDHPNCLRGKTETPEPATVSSGGHLSSDVIPVSPSTGSVPQSESTGLVTSGHLVSPPASSNVHILTLGFGSVILLNLLVCLIVAGLIGLVWWLWRRRARKRKKRSSTSGVSEENSEGDQSLPPEQFDSKEPLLGEVVMTDETRQKTESKSKGDNQKPLQHSERDQGFYPTTEPSSLHGDLPTDAYMSNWPPLSRGLGDDDTSSNGSNGPVCPQNVEVNQLVKATPSLPHAGSPRTPPIPIDDSPVQERTWSRVKAGNDGDEEWGRTPGTGGEGEGGGLDDRGRGAARDRVNEQDRNLSVGDLEPDQQPQSQSDDDSGGNGGGDSQPDSLVSNLSQASTVPVRPIRDEAVGDNSSVNGQLPADLLSGVMPPTLTSSAGPARAVSSLTSSSVVAPPTAGNDTPPVIEPLTLEPEGRPPSPNDRECQTETRSEAAGIHIYNYGNGDVITNVNGKQTVNGLLSQAGAARKADDATEATSLPVPTCQAESETQLKSIANTGQESARSPKLGLPVEETGKPGLVSG